MQKNITSLRNHLFDALNRLAEASCEDDVNREISKSASIVHVADAIIRTAEVENQFLQITGGTGSEFIPLIKNGNTPNLIDLASEAKKSELFNSDENKNWLQ